MPDSTLTTTQIAILTGSFGVVGAIIGQIVSFVLNRRFIKKQALMNERINFQSAFTETQRLLTQRPAANFWKNKTSAHHVLENHISEHERFFIRFKYQLSKSDRISFQSTWNKYKNDYNAGKFRSNGIENEKTKRKCVLDIIETLLEFAK